MKERSDTKSTTLGEASLSPTQRLGRSTFLAFVYPEERWVPIDHTPLRFGRSSHSDVQLSGALVSREHAELLEDGPLLVLRDLGSRNGVHHRGNRVEEAALEVQDVIRIGEWIAIVVTAPGSAERGALIEDDGIIAGPAMRRLLERARKVAASTLPVILQGETGVGKEVVSRRIHQHSGRSGAFVAVNCAALPETLAEAQLFGHRKGAFTGAAQSAPGFIRAAHRGTLLLDEIADLSLSVQSKLLRVLEEGSVTPVGEAMPVDVDVRVIAAGQDNLAELVNQGRFRGDLYARLSGVELFVPPLRDRREEVLPALQRMLTVHLAGRSPALAPTLVEHLCQHDWPFNMREVTLLARQLAVLHGDEPLLTIDHLPERIRTGPALSSDRSSDRPSQRPSAPPVREELSESGEQLSASEDAADEDRATPAADEADPMTLVQRERQLQRETQLKRLVEALRRHGGNVSRAAQAVGISRQTAYRLMDLGGADGKEGRRGPAD